MVADQGGRETHLGDLDAPDEISISSTVETVKSREDCAHVVGRGKMDCHSET